MDEKQLFYELDVIKRLLAAIAIKDQSFKQQVKLLSDAGLTPTEIADITGKSPNLVNVTKHHLKKTKGGKNGSETV